MLPLAKASLDPLQSLTSLLHSFIPWLIAWGVLSLLVAWLKRRFLPKFKGAAGEWAVNRALLKNLDPDEYQVLHDLLIPDGKGGMTQIDHVVVSAFGIFVIETKNWDCWVHGSDRGREWTLTYLKGGRKKAMNPLHQNEGHVKTIVTLLGVKREHCHNLVFINPLSQIKTGPITGVFQQGLSAHIRSFRETVIDPAWTQHAVNQLKAASMSEDKQAVKAHHAQVQSKQQARPARLVPSVPQS